MRVWILVGVLAACGGSGKTPPGGKPPAGGKEAVSEAVRKRVCAAEPCGGAASSITVYRDAGGAVKRLVRMYGPCSHNPALYFDAAGVQTEAVEEKPVVAGSDEAKAFAAKREAQIGGLTEAEALGCR